MRFDHQGWDIYTDDGSYLGTFQQEAGEDAFYFCASSDAELSLEDLQKITKKLGELNGCAIANNVSAETWLTSAGPDEY